VGYREKCYKNYVSTQFGFMHPLTKKEYDFNAKILRKRYKNILPKTKDAKILDVACGSGQFLYFLQKEGYRNIFGVDISPEQVEKAQNIGIKNIIEENCFAYLKRNQKEFDMIIASDIIEHFYKDEIILFLELMLNSLRPHWKILINTQNAQSLFTSAARYIDFTHELSFSPSSLSQVLGLTGFVGIQVFGEKPIVHDVRSAIRSFLWFYLKAVMKGYFFIESGTGRDMYGTPTIFEPRMSAIARKKK